MFTIFNILSLGLLPLIAVDAAPSLKPRAPAFAQQDFSWDPVPAPTADGVFLDNLPIPGYKYDKSWFYDCDAASKVTLDIACSHAGIHPADSAASGNGRWSFSQSGNCMAAAYFPDNKDPATWRLCDIGDSAAFAAFRYAMMKDTKNTTRASINLKQYPDMSVFNPPATSSGPQSTSFDPNWPSEPVDLNWPAYYVFS